MKTHLTQTKHSLLADWQSTYFPNSLPQKFGERNVHNVWSKTEQSPTVPFIMLAVPVNIVELD